MGTYTGTQVRRWQSAQVARAHADDFVIYISEWYLGGVTPGPYGQFHIEQIGRCLAHENYPVIIQVDPTKPGLNEARQAEIVGRLSLCGVPEPEKRVVIGHPAALGLLGDEAALVYMRLLYGGLGTGGGGGVGGGGIGGGGFGGGGGLGVGGGLGGLLGGVGGGGGIPGANYR
jgi:hypothetical protein